MVRLNVEQYWVQSNIPVIRTLLRFLVRQRLHNFLLTVQVIERIPVYTIPLFDSIESGHGYIHEILSVRPQFRLYFIQYLYFCYSNQWACAMSWPSDEIIVPRNKLSSRHPIFVFSKLYWRSMNYYWDWWNHSLYLHLYVSQLVCESVGDSRSVAALAFQNDMDPAVWILSANTGDYGKGYEHISQLFSSIIEPWI